MQPLKRKAIAAIAAGKYPVELYLRYENTDGVVTYDHTTILSDTKDKDVQYHVSNQTGEITVSVHNTGCCNHDLLQWADDDFRFLTEEQWTTYLYLNIVKS